MSKQQKKQVDVNMTEKKGPQRDYTHIYTVYIFLACS